MNNPIPSGPALAGTQPCHICQTMMGKPLMWADARILNLDSGFRHKLLCDGPTFSAGTACAFSCVYCYVKAIVGAKPFVTALLNGSDFQKVVIRRRNAVERLKQELRTAQGRLKFKGGEYEAARLAGNPVVCYGSPLVDVAATKELADETVQILHVLLADTDWDVRLLSKSPLIKTIAQSLTNEQRHRVIFGLSIGTLDDRLARAIEPTCPSASERVKAHRWLQDNGCRTFAMLCPILPQPLEQFVSQAVEALRPEQCEHVWAEVLNVRGDSMKRTLMALQAKNLTQAAADLQAVCGSGNRDAWEQYARQTFQALSGAFPTNGSPAKLRFLQYVNCKSLSWWSSQRAQGAILLGKDGAQPSGEPATDGGINSLSPRAPSSVNQAVSCQSEVVRLADQLVSLSTSAAELVAAAAKLVECGGELVRQVSTFSKTLEGLQLNTMSNPNRRVPDPKRSEAAKRAWVTIRKNRAAASAS